MYSECVARDGSDATVISSPCSGHVRFGADNLGVLYVATVGGAVEREGSELLVENLIHHALSTQTATDTWVKDNYCFYHKLSVSNSHSEMIGEILMTASTNWSNIQD